MCEADTYEPKEKEREYCGTDDNFGADNRVNMRTTGECGIDNQHPEENDGIRENNDNSLHCH